MLRWLLCYDGLSLQSRRVTCSRLSKYGFMLCFVTNPAFRNRENFVLCFANIVLCLNIIVLCFSNTVLCFDKPLLCLVNTVLCLEKCLLCSRNVFLCLKIRATVILEYITLTRLNYISFNTKNYAGFNWTKNSSCVQELVTGFRKSSAHPAKSNDYNQILYCWFERNILMACLRSLNVKWNGLKRCRLFRLTTPQGYRCARFPCRTAGGITRNINSTLPSVRMWDSYF